jgi:predicted regulator of Ras-like GTPase activity (Roadblock/LC7/MglB family)
MPPQEETLLCSADLPASSELQAALKEEPKESIAEDAAAIPPSATVLMQSAPLGGEKKRGFFASLPIFRRHQAPSSLPTKPILPPLPMPLQESVVTPHLSPDVSFVREITPSPPIFPSRKPSETEGKLSAPKLERLWKLDPQDPLADPTALQSLFMTEEKLTLERVIFLAGQLPGLRACVLAHGDQVVSASNIPEGIDLRTLSREAMTMLSQLRDSSATMGLGGVPAITLHGEQGVLSFLYQGKICLLVLHADRGFLPGVRERLQEMLGHLSSAKSVLESHNTQPNLPI